jgi:hypothetical protein
MEIKTTEKGVFETGRSPGRNHNQAGPRDLMNKYNVIESFILPPLYCPIP